jgi:hypothetical protein
VNVDVELFPKQLPLVYVAGPHEKPDMCVNTHNALLAANRIYDLCTPVVPHLSHFWHTMSPKPWDVWMRFDLDYLRRCDALLRLPGASRGAEIEESAANMWGIPVFHTIPSLREWLKKQAA